MPTARLDTAQFRRLLSLARPHAKALALATFSLIVGSGIGLLYPQAAKFAIDDVIREGGIAGYDISTLALGLLLLFAVQAVFVSLRYYLFVVTGDRIVTDLRQRLYGAILAQEMAFFDQRMTGELTSRLANDTQVLENAVTSNLSMLLRYGAQAIGGGILLWVTSWRLALILSVVLPVVLIGSIAYGRAVRRLSRQVQDAIAESTAVAEEAIAGVRTVRSFAREPQEEVRYQGATEHAFGLAKKRALLGGGFGGVVIFIGYSAVAVVLWFGVGFVRQGVMSAGDLVAFILYTLLVAFSLGVLSGLYGDLMKAIGASERVFGLIDRVPQMQAPQVMRTQPPPQASVGFKGVSFSYPTRPEARALEGVSFEIEPGQRVALVGASGSGKSTVAALISRFYDPQQGHITLGGVPITAWDPQQLRQWIGLVAQEPILFSGTIRHNVQYGRPGAPDEEVWEALEVAAAAGFVRELPGGLETEIGERGVRLSGGQKQRIAIARAVLKDPRVLLLDEATSALDVESETLVQRALERLMQGRTTLIIAHRLSTIQGADQIVVLGAGKVLESGGHQDLMAKPQGHYRRLVLSQQFLS